MTRLQTFRNRISLQMLIVIAAIALAPVFGIALAAATRGQTLPFLIIGGIVGIFVTLYAPIELLLLAGILGTMLADTRFNADFIYYGRFVPMGMLTIRTLLDVVMRRNTFTRVERSLLLPGLFFSGIALFSISYSITPELTFQRILSMLFVVIVLGLGLPNYLNTFSKLSRITKLVILLLGSFILVGAVAGGRSGVYEEDTFFRLNGFFKNPNTQGLMAMLIFYPLVWWRQIEEHRWLKSVLTVLVLGWAVLVVLSGSRASFVGMISGAFALVILYGRARARYGLALLVGLTVAIALTLFVPEFSRGIEITEPSTGPAIVGGVRQVDRPFLIQRAIELGMRSPIYGVGFSASDKVFADDVPYLKSIGVYIAGSHNSYTRMFVDLGIVGLLSAFWAFIIILGRAFFAPDRIRRDPTVAFMTAAVVAGLVNAFFEDWLFGFGNSSTLPLWFFLALIPIRMTQLQNEHAEISDAAPEPTHAEGMA